MERCSVEDGAVRVATYNREHQAVVNDDGSIDVYRRPTKLASDCVGDRSRTAFESINRRNREFWAAFDRTSRRRVGGVAERNCRRKATQ
jgi:hypothetical protein